MICAQLCGVVGVHGVNRPNENELISKADGVGSIV
jgi:hypothetical protein